MAKRSFLDRVLRRRQLQSITEVSDTNLVQEITRRNVDVLSTIEGFLKEPKPDSLTVDTIDRMLKNGVMKSGITILKSPIISTLQKSYFESEDEVVAAFLNQYMHPIMMRHLNTILTSLEWGVSFHEKVFESVENLKIKIENKDGDVREHILPTALIYKKLKFNPYRSIKGIKVDKEQQDFDGYVQEGKIGTLDTVTVPAWKAFVFAFEPDESLWGKTSLLQAYAPWYSYELMAGYYVRYGEYSAAPPLIGRAPLGVSRVNSATGFKLVDNMNWLTAIAGAAGNSKAIIFPSDFDPISKEPKWDLHEMKLADRSSLFKDALSWLERAMLIALFAPQQAMGSGSSQTGSNSVGEIEFEAFLVTEYIRILMLANAVKSWLAKPLVELNFGPDIEFDLITPDVTTEIRDRTFQTLAQLIKAGHPQAMNADLFKMYQALGIATREIPEEELRQRAIDEMNKAGNTGKDDDEEDEEEDEDTDEEDNDNQEDE